MPKMKPHKGMRRRVTVSANGKVRHKNAGGGHLLSGKPGTKRQRFRKKSTLKGKFNKNALRALCLE
jgi:large subunit ribosomal protein L35